LIAIPNAPEPDSQLPFGYLLQRRNTLTFAQRAANAVLLFEKASGSHGGNPLFPGCLTNYPFTISNSQFPKIKEKVKKEVRSMKDEG
jgi:hypothetical protein